MNGSVGHRLAAAMLSFVLGLACGDPQASDDGAVTCEHGSTSECACPDGSMGTQLCAHDTSGYEPCVCDGDTDDTSDPTASSGPSTSAPTTTAGTSASTSVGTTTSTGDDSSSSGADGSSSSDSGSSSAGPIGAPPIADIFHPSDGEERTVNVAIPWIGSGDDAEDGALTGAALVWSSSLDGELGTGEMLDAPLVTVGTHTITLTVTDGDGNVGEDAIEIEVVAP